LQKQEIVHYVWLVGGGALVLGANVLYGFLAVKATKENRTPWLATSGILLLDLLAGFLIYGEYISAQIGK
jgi:hypothetical protein